MARRPAIKAVEPRSFTTAAEAFAFANDAIAQHDFEDARLALVRVVELDPAHAEAHANLGALSIDRNAISEARIHLLRSVQLAPKVGRFRFLASIALERDGALAEALSHAREAVKLDPYWVEGLRQLGRLCGRAGELRACVEAWKKVIELAGTEDREAATALGIALSNEGRHEEAITHLRRAIELAPQSSDGHADLGMAEFAAGKTDEAAASFERALERDSASPQAHLGLGLLAFQSSRWSDAIREFRAAARAADKSEVAHYNLGLAYEAVGELGRARAAFLRAAAFAPDDAEIDAALQRILIAEKEAQTARLEGDPDHSINGDLRSFSLPNLLEFLRLQGKTGTVMLASPAGAGVVRMSKGQLISASAPRSQRLGDMLRSRGLLTREQLERSLLEQTSMADDIDGAASLGAIILGKKWIEESVLREVIFAQLLGALDEMLQWEHGSFSFQIGAFVASPPILTFDVQATLLEIFRRRDEDGVASEAI